MRDNYTPGWRIRKTFQIQSTECYWTDLILFVQWQSRQIRDCCTVVRQLTRNERQTTVTVLARIHQMKSTRFHCEPIEMWEYMHFLSSGKFVTRVSFENFLYNFRLKCNQNRNSNSQPSRCINQQEWTNSTEINNTSNTTFIISCHIYNVDNNNHQLYTVS